MTGPATAARVRPRLAPVALVLGAYVLTRLLVAAVAALQPGPLDLEVLAPWDGVYYLEVAESGYPRAFPDPGAQGAAARSPLAFLPGYPLAVRALALTGLSTLAAGVLLSLTAGAAAAVAVLGLARALLPPGRALGAALLWVCWPGTAVLSFVYAEGLFLAATAAGLLALLRRHWALAGMLGAVASCTRPSGLALGAAAGLAALAAVRERGEWRAVLAPLGCLAGLAGYLVFLQQHTGDASGWLGLQERGWGQRLDLGVGFGSFVNSPADLLSGIWLLYGIGFAALAGCLWTVRRGARLPLPLVGFVAVLLAQCLLYSNVGPRPRLLLAAVPLFLLVPQVTGRRTTAALAVLFVVLLAVVTALHLQGVVAP